MNKFVIVSTVTDVFLIMCQIFVNATGLWTLLGNNHDLMIMQSWFDENAMKQLTFLTLDYICISRSGTPSRYTEIHFVNNCLSKKRNRPQKRPPNAKSSNANEVPPLNNSYLRVGGLTYQTSDLFNTNQYAMTTGKLALFKTGAEAPTPEQMREIYQDEKKLFAPNAKCDNGSTNPYSRL